MFLKSIRLLAALRRHQQSISGFRTVRLIILLMDTAAYLKSGRKWWRRES